MVEIFGSKTFVVARSSIVAAFVNLMSAVVDFPSNSKSDIVVIFVDNR